jgi:hypothetical protein
MYISEILTKTTTGKVSHRCILLRESYRDAEQVKTRTLANLTHCPPDDIAALRWAFQHPYVFVSADDRARLLERLATDTLDAEDRAVLAQVVQALPPARPAPTGAARPRARRPRRTGTPARPRPEP